MEFEYYEVKAQKYTFDIPEAKNFVEKYAKGLVLNLFAGKNKLNLNEIRNDLSKKFKPDYNLEARNFVKFWLSNFPGVRFDTIILDPPFSYRKSKELYDNKKISNYKLLKDEIISILKPGGIIISFGYNTVGLGRDRGFKKIAILNLCHLGDFDNTMGVAEQSNFFILKDENIKDYFGLVEKYKNNSLNKFIVN